MVPGGFISSISVVIFFFLFFTQYTQLSWFSYIVCFLFLVFYSLYGSVYDGLWECIIEQAVHSFGLVSRCLHRL